MSGLINSDLNPHFKMLRKLASSSLKIYAEGLVGMEKMTIEESSHLHEKLLKTKGKPVDLHKMMGKRVLVFENIQKLHFISFKYIKLIHSLLI